MGTATNSLPVMTQQTKHLALKRIGWLYPIFRDLHFYHGLLGSAVEREASPAERLGQDFGARVDHFVLVG